MLYLFSYEHNIFFLMRLQKRSEGLKRLIFGFLDIYESKTTAVKLRKKVRGSGVSVLKSVCLSAVLQDYKPDQLLRNPTLYNKYWACVVKGIDCCHVYWYLTSYVRINSLVRKVEHNSVPVQDWKAQSQEQEEQQVVVMVWDAAGKWHPVRAGDGRVLLGGQGWVRMGHLTLCCSVTRWKSENIDLSKQTRYKYFLNAVAKWKGIIKKK